MGAGPAEIGTTEAPAPACWLNAHASLMIQLLDVQDKGPVVDS